MYKYSLLGKSTGAIPGSLIGKLPEINAKNEVATVALRENVIAAYGAKNDENGAVLLVYELNLKLVQAEEKFEQFDCNAKLWKHEDKLLLAANNKYLYVIPYKLASQKIGSRLGCLKFKSVESGALVVKKSKKVPKQISQLQDQGISNTVIQRELIPQFININDTKSILWCFDNFHYISEDLLVLLLHYCLNLPNNIVETSLNGSTSENNSNDAKNNVLQTILLSGFSRMPMIREIRSKLNLDEVINLLEILVSQYENKTDENLRYEQIA